jgi:flavin reductase (DIM6/NTAB) family NADH-FMN oxidoreductase RutF
VHFAFLGTSGAVPSLGRDNTSIVFVGPGGAVLLDCGGSPIQKLLLAAVDHANDMHAAMVGATHFVVNILAADQEALARAFAAETTNRFDGVGYRENRHGIPLLNGALAHIECAKHAEVPGGDHTVFVGLVTGGEVTERRPLLYFRGDYGL